MRRAWMLIATMIAFGGCRQVFGIEAPAPVGDGPPVSIDGRTDGHIDFHDGGSFAPGLAMYVLNGTALWTADQAPDTAWGLADPGHAKADVWTGTGPTQAQLTSDGVTGNTPFSVWMEGEVHAEAGNQMLVFSANDYAFFDAEPIPNSGAFVMIASSTHGVTAMPTSSTSAGWFRVRIGWSCSSCAPSLQILHEDTTSPDLQPYNSTNLRH